MATADNLKIAQQLLATMQQITVQVERQTEAYHAQAQLVEALCKAQECFGKIDADKVREVTEALREAQEKTKAFGVELANTAEKEAGKLEGAIGKIAEKVRKLSIPGEFLNGFKAGLKVSNQLFENILSLGGTAFGLLKDIGMALLSIPGRIMDFFQNAASGGTDPYTEALEELRDEFGDLSVGTSAAIKDMTESTKKLGESGLALSRVFGHGREGMAALLRENMALFKEMGPLGDRLAASLRGVEGEFTLLRKATGLTGEAMKAFQLRAEENGMSGAQATREMTLALAQGQRAFGISVKQFGRDMEVMLKDTVTFGILAPREMVKVSAYVKKLGISMETLKKVTDKAFNFEDAAQQAAKLSEAFGIALDPLKQMEADPVKKMDNLRQAFFKTGQRYESMSAQARKYLADQAGISDEEARIAFSQKNRAMTGAQVEAQMKKQQKAQMSQAEAMKILAESVKRLVKSGEPMKGSFFDVFAKGFESGIRRTKEFREVVRNMQRSLRVVYWAGRDVGRMFVKEFPGVKEMLKSLADMFNPRRFRALMYLVTSEFRTFFKTLQTDPKAGVENFMKNMKKIFFDFFTKGAPAGSRFLDGAKSFFKAIGMIFIEGLRHALSSLKDLLNLVIGWIRNPESLSRVANEAGDGIIGMFRQAFDYARTELGPLFVEVGGLLWELLKLAFSTLYTKYIEPNIGKILLAYFAPAIIGGLLRGGGALIAQGLVALIMRSTQASQAIAAGMTQTTRVTGADGTVTETTIQRQAAQQESMSRQLLKLAASLAILIAAVAVTVLAIIGLAKVYEKSGIKMESFLIVGVMVGAIAALMFGMVKLGFFEAVTQVGSTLSDATAKGIGALALTIAAIELLALGVIGLAHLSPEPEKVRAVAELMVVMTALFFAAAPLLAVAVLIGAGAATGIGSGLATVGIVAIGAALVAIAGTARLVVDKFAGVQEAQVRSTALIMEKITNLYQVIGRMMEGVLTYARGDGVDRSREINSIIDKITGIIHKIAEGTLSILDRVRTLGNASEMQAQANVISSILQGMAAIMAPLANFASAVASNSFSGIDPNVFTQFGNAATSIIEKLATAITRIMNEIKTLVSSVSNIEALKTAGAVIAETMRSIAGLLGAIMQMFPSEGGSRVTSTMGAGAGGAAVGAMIGSVVPGLGTAIGAGIGFVVGAAIGWMSQRDEFSKRFEAIRGVITTVAQSMNGLVSGITGPLSTLLSTRGITQESVKGAEVMTNIMTFIAQFIPALLRGAEGIANIRDMTPDRARELIDKMKNMITESMGSIKQAIETIGTFVSTVLNSLGTDGPVRTDRLKGMENIAAIFGAIGNIVVNMAQQAGNMLYNVTSQGGRTENVISRIQNARTFITEVMGSVPSVITQLTGSIQPLITSLNAIPVPKGFTAKINALRSIFDFISSITNVFSNFMRGVEEIRRLSGRSGGDLSADIEGFKTHIRNLLNFFNDEGPQFSSASGAGQVGVIVLLRQLITNIGNLDFGIGGTKSIVGKMTALKTVFEALGAITNTLKTIQESFGTTGTTSTGSVDVEKITRALSSMSSILTAITNPVLDATAAGAGVTNILYDEALQRKVVQINSILRKGNFVGALTSLKDKLRSIFDAANNFPVLETNDSTYVTKARNALIMLHDVTDTLTKQELETGKINPFFDLERATNPIVKASQLSTGLRSKNIGRNFTNLHLELANIFGGMSNITLGLGNLARPDLDVIKSSLNQYFGTDQSEGSLLLTLDSFFGDDTVANRVESITRQMRGRITTNIAAMVQAYNAFSRDLALFNRDISVTMTASGAALGGRQTAEVRNAAVNAQINVQVNIEAKQLVTALETQSRSTATGDNLRMRTDTFVRTPIGTSG